MPKVSSEDTLLTPKQTAKVLTVQLATLKMWRHRKKGPAYVRLASGDVRYPEQNVREYMEQSITVVGTKDQPVPKTQSPRGGRAKTRR